jgi:GNAT superfamily N-acetyltransferase
MEIRLGRPEEFAAVGELVVEVYDAIDPYELGEYADELRDVAGRAASADILVAVDDDGTLLGAVTYVPGPASPLAEFDDPDGAGIRMLAVAQHAQGRGIGRALVRACLDRARATGRRQLLLHTTDWMTTAHRLYAGMGFERDPSMDWRAPESEGEFWLRGFRMRLDGPNGDGPGDRGDTDDPGDSADLAGDDRHRADGEPAERRLAL